jgi:hypothetical protein
MLPSRLLIVRQNFPNLRLGDVCAEGRHQLERSGFVAGLRPDARVAIGVGSPNAKPNNRTVQVRQMFSRGVGVSWDRRRAPSA